MKVKAELDLKVEMGGVSHDGTGCQGYLPEGTRYEDIMALLRNRPFCKYLRKG